MKIELYHNKGCNLCLPIEQMINMVQMLLSSKKVYIKFEKVETKDEDVPKLVFYKKDKPFIKLNGMFIADVPEMQLVGLMRQILFGIFECNKSKRVEKLIKDCDHHYFYGDPQYFMTLREMKNIKKLEHLYNHYKCDGKKKNIARRLKELKEK